MRNADTGVCASEESCQLSVVSSQQELVGRVIRLAAGQIDPAFPSDVDVGSNDPTYRYIVTRDSCYLLADN